MVKRTKDVIEREALIAKIPADAHRVQVITEKGQKKYRPVKEIAKNDVIQTTDDGMPVVMKGKPGRPRDVKLAPVTPAVAEMVKRKKEAINNDPLLVSVKTKPEDIEVLQQVVLALGEEAASLGFERKEAERTGRESSNISVRRVNTLKAMADTWLKRRDQLVSKGVDINSPAFKAVLQYLLETFKGAMLACGIEADMVDTVFARLSQEMGEEWETEVRHRMTRLV